MIEFSSLVAGAGLGFSLIVAIGAQNAFVLRQGLARNHIWVVVIICALSDVILVSAGVIGVGRLASVHPILLDAARFGGAAFVLAYGLIAVRRILRPNALPDAHLEHTSIAAVTLTTLAITWLNPYVYLDTVILLGSVASTHDAKVSFGLGACIASTVWFIGLGYASRHLRRLFSKTMSWRILDGVIAATMFAIGTNLIVGTS